MGDERRQQRDEPLHSGIGAASERHHRSRSCPHRCCALESGRL